MFISGRNDFKKSLHIYLMKYYPEINKNKLEVYEITRINLKSVILNKRVYHMIPFIKVYKQMELLLGIRSH